MERFLHHSCRGDAQCKPAVVHASSVGVGVVVTSGTTTFHGGYHRAVLVKLIKAQADVVQVVHEPARIWSGDKVRGEGGCVVGMPYGLEKTVKNKSKSGEGGK